MTTLKKHIEELYDSREAAEKNAKLWQEWFGYEYQIVLEENGRGFVRYRLILDTNQVMMG